MWKELHHLTVHSNLLHNSFSLFFIANTYDVCTYRKLKISIAEELLNEETAAYEEGVRYLAYMMGKNPENFSKDDIQEAVGYLFPSSLYNRSARPIFSVSYFINSFFILSSLLTFKLCVDVKGLNFVACVDTGIL